MNRREALGLVAGGGVGVAAAMAGLRGPTHNHQPLSKRSAVPSAGESH